MNKLVEAKKEVFVQPYYIEALGGDGLSSEEIAQSLETEGKKVRQKLAAREFAGTLSQLGLRVLSVTLKNNNGVEYEEFYLDTAAAKFFVARYENEMGNAYLAYLVRLDMAVEEKCRQYEKDYLAQSKRMTLLSEKYDEVNTEYEKLLNEPITEEECDILIRTVNKTLKRQGRMRPAYKNGFNKEIISKFYLPGEDPGTYTYLPRRNFKAAILYARNREFDWTTMKEFK